MSGAPPGIHPRRQGASVHRSHRRTVSPRHLKDYSDRILTDEEINRLLGRSQPAFKAMILLGVNCGLGPADLGRLRWHMVDLERGTIRFLPMRNDS